MLEMMDKYFDSIDANTNRDILANKNKYERLLNSTTACHSEQLLTLVALYGIFQDQKENNVQEINNLLKNVFSARNISHSPEFKNIEKVSVEVSLSENITYRKWLLEKFKIDPFHFYNDCKEIIKKKVSNKNASFEGNTNVDAIIKGVDQDDTPIYIFLEAKYLSDIASGITYFPIRNQIARTIDCSIEWLKNKKLGINNFWFLLLTPEIFRTKEYNKGNRDSNKTVFDNCESDRSKLYCYKMNDYLQYELLKKDLPHREELTDDEWKSITKRIGWLTYEEIVKKLLDKQLLEEEFETQFKDFMNIHGFLRI